MLCRVGSSGSGALYGLGLFLPLSTGDLPLLLCVCGVNGVGGVGVAWMVDAGPVVWYPCVCTWLSSASTYTFALEA